MEANEQLPEKDTEEDVLKVLLRDKKLYSELYPHQRDGVLFLYNAYKNGKSKAEGSRNGVILADEMGLGKSIQVIVFLHFMIMKTRKWKNALLVMPPGLLGDWKGKLENWTPDMTVLIYQNCKKELLIKMRRFQKTGGILLVSYKMFVYHHETLTTYKGMPFVWDCLVFDEAHKLKNTATKNHKVAASISAGFHILMTGTPIQNNLKEYWSLVSLISDTCLLGTYKTFKNNFENPITKGMAADSVPEERALGMELQKALEKITEPILLRRRKDQIQDSSDHTPSEGGLCLPKKNEYVVWIKLSPEQEAAYCNIVHDSSILTFQSIHYLIAVCTHPRLNSDIMAQKAREVHLAESGKLSFMLALLETLTTNGNFVLVFSNYIKILDIIQKALKQTPWGRNAFLRIDGQNPNQRDEIVNRFQKKRRENILLLTTSVGSEGLTLTAADSVVFADLSWNQSVDAQAVGRAHRIGQTKEVVTYRLITCGTLEETMYWRQLFKGSLTRQSMGDEQNPLRHFTQNELQTYLTLQQTQFSYTQNQLEKQGAKILNITEIFGEGISSLGAASVCGISDHGQLLRASQGEDLAVDMARMQITETAKMCKKEIEAESHLTRQQTGEDLSVWKCVKKDKIRRKTQKATTPGLPRKYKCFKTPFSGTRRKTLHISRPCVFESSDDSSNLSADEDIRFCEKSLPHISFSVKSEVTNGLVDKYTYTCNSTCSKGNSGKNKSTNSKDTVVSECISKESTELDPDGSPVTDLNMDLPNVADENKSGSPATDLEQDVSSVAVPVNISDYTEHISTPGNSELELDRLENTLDSDISDSQSQKSSASSTMSEHSFSTYPEDSHIEKSGSSHLPEANISANIATDKSVPDISLMQPNETDDITYLKEEANSPGANFKAPKVKKIPVISEQNKMACDKTALNLNSDSYQDPPYTSAATPSASPCTAQNMILDQEDQKLQEATKDKEVDMAVCIEETTTISLQEIEDKSPFSKQTCIDVATRKPDRKAMFRRWSYETTTASQPRKYKCYTSPLSSTRRKTTHTSRPCVFDLSDGYSFTAHEEKITERTILNMSVTDLNMYVLPATEVKHEAEGVSTVATLANSSVHPEHISTPDNSKSVFESPHNTSDTNDSDTIDSDSYTSSASSTMDEHSISTSHEDSNIEKRGSSPQYHKTVSANVSYVSDEDNYMNKYDKGCLQEANISVTSRSVIDTSLVQSSETDNILTDLKEEANSQTVKCSAQQELKIQVNDEFEERVPLLPLNLNTLFSENSLHSTTFVPSHEKELQLLDSSCEDFKTGLKSNQVVPVLCDYSLTPSCISVCLTPSAGNRKHNNELRQLEECDEFCVYKEEENCQDVSTTFLDLRAHSSEYCQQLNLPQIQGSELVQSSSEREVNIKDHEVADICYKDSSNSELKFTQHALKLCEYTLTPGCVSLVDSPSVEKRKHALSGNVQSSPLKSGQVVHQESPDHLKRRLSFSHVNSSTPVKSPPKGKLCESSQLKRTPGLPRKYKCFSPSLVKTARKTKLIFQENDSNSNFSQVRKTVMDRNEVQIINSEKQMEQSKISMNKTATEKAFNAKEYSHFTVSNRKRSTRTKFIDSTFSTTTPEWKNGKENHERLIPTMCGNSLNPREPKSSPQAGNMTQIQPVKRQLLTREDTDQLCPMNRAVDTNQPENHMSRAKTVESEMFSPKNASVIIKAFRRLLFPKRQHRRTSRDYSCNSKRPNFSMTYRRHQNKLLKSMKNVYKNPKIVDKSDAHVSFIPNEYIHGSVANKSASASPSVSCPKLTKEMSPIQKVQGSIQYQCIMPLNEIPEGELVQSTNIVYREVKSVHGLFTEGSLKTPVLKGTSASLTQLNQVIQSFNTDHYPRGQECSTAKTLKCASREDNKDHELQSSIQDEIFFMSPISSAPDSVTFNGQAQVVKSFTSGHKPMWEMSFSPEIQHTPRKESNIPKGTNQANLNPHKLKTETFSDNESGQQLAFESYIDCCFITEKNDDSDDSVKQASGPVATLVTYSAQNPSERTITAERDERGGIQAFRDIRHFCDQTNRASEISEIQPQAQEKGDYAELSECHKAPPEEGQESMFKYTQNDTKSEKASDLQTPVDEIFCLLHKLKRL